MAYDVVLSGLLPSTGGKKCERTARLDELGVACVVKGVRYLGLRLSPRKTDAMWFQGGTRRGPPQKLVCVEDALVVVRRRIRYMSLTPNSGWRLEQLFGALASILEEVTAGLGQLLLNTGRLEARMRGLHAGMIYSMALFVAPWLYSQIHCGRWTCWPVRKAASDLLESSRGWTSGYWDDSSLHLVMMPRRWRGSYR
ncbi:uncharacterized protein LOC143220305 [Lasioglossum baleicum]|uniref:uncharacterized protein LOC143220305 n=1 Tax=Lasioglossum baleicum TaxID=434251 RepID=UPI003FCE45DB